MASWRVSRVGWVGSDLSISQLSRFALGRSQLISESGRLDWWNRSGSFNSGRSEELVAFSGSLCWSIQLVRSGHEIGLGWSKWVGQVVLVGSGRSGWSFWSVGSVKSARSGRLVGSVGSIKPIKQSGETGPLCWVRIVSWTVRVGWLHRVGGSVGLSPPHSPEHKIWVQRRFQSYVSK